MAKEKILIKKKKTVHWKYKINLRRASIRRVTGKVRQVMLNDITSYTGREQKKNMRVDSGSKSMSLRIKKKKEKKINAEV